MYDTLLSRGADYRHRMVAEGITEIAYGVHSDGEIDFIETYDELSLVAIKTLRGYLVDIFPWRKCVVCLYQVR